ncbi:hypothetical protein, partial [Nostoc sp. WHI]|uniref:hypothetical protein n=1 Tax=Nostoc sp. WHI TaxID=2650611 RepID=UPI001E3D9B68
MKNFCIIHVIMLNPVFCSDDTCTPTRTIFKIIANGRESELRIEAGAGGSFGVTAGILSRAVGGGVGGRRGLADG